MLRRNWKELGSIERASVVILIVLSVCIQVSLAGVTTISGNEPVPLEAVQADTYNDGARCLRFAGTCNTTTVYIEIIQADGTKTSLNFPGSKYNISQANFCYPNSSTSTSQKRDLWGSIERHFYRRHEVKTTCSESKSRQIPTSYSEECTTTSSSKHNKECTTTTSKECTTTTSKECTTTSPSRHSEECTTTSSSQHNEECDTTSSSQHGKECTATGSSQHDKECNCQHSHKHHSSKEHHHSSKKHHHSIPCGGVVHKTHTTGGTHTHVTTTGTGKGPGPTGTGTGNGPNGPTGTGTGNGPNGPNGPTGTGGPNGPNGPTGTGGPNGPNGPNGPTGTGGPNGPNGPNTGGPNGPTGTETGNSPTGTGGITTGSGATATGTSTSGRKSTSTTQTTIPTGGVVIPNNQYSGNASAINIYAIRHNFVLITYFIDFPITRRISGLILSWGGDISSTIDFDTEKECTSSQIIKNVDENGFMRVCFNETMKELDWTIYSSPDKDTGAVTSISRGTIQNFTEFSNNTKIFSIEHNKYGVAQPTHTSGTWTIIIYWIDYQTHGPYTLYKLPDDNVTRFDIFQCNIAYQYLGYSCLICTEQKGVEKPVFIDIDFYSSGSLNGTHSFSIDQIPNDQTPFGAETLRYGGYLVLTKNDITITGFATTNEGQNITQWGLPTSYNYLPLTGCSDENVVWALNQNETNNESWTILSSDSLRDYDKVNAYGTSTVVSTTPGINKTVSVSNSGPMNFTIQYSLPVETSSGNMSIYYMNGTNKTRCFVAPANWGSVQDQDRNTYKMKVPNGVICKPQTSYYVEVDNGFVTDSSNGQSLPKMSNTWFFNTSDAAGSSGGGPVSVIILLIPEGTTNFVKKTIDRNVFVTNLRDDIAGVIGCSSDRLSIPTKFQYKHDTSSDQIFMRVDISEAKSSTDTDASILAGYLDSVIEYKNMTAIATGSAARYLDSNNGAWRRPNLWDKYKWVLFSLFGLLFLFILWLWARHKYSKGQNLLAFVLWPLILVDFGLDIAFVASHGKDEKWLYPTSIVFLVVPIAFCILFTFWIIGRDLKEHNRFSQWWRQHSKVALIFTIFSGIDNESLNVMSSRAAGYRAFNAPFSQVAVQRIFYTTVFIIIIEDFAQLIFLIIYQTVIVIPAIIPILVLASCILIILLKIICLIIYSSDDDDGIFDDKPAVEESTINDTTIVSTEHNNLSIGAGPISDSYAEIGRETTGYNLPPMTQLESEHPRQQHLLNIPDRERTGEITETETIITGGRHPTSFGSGRGFEETETETIITGGRHPTSFGSGRRFEETETKTETIFTGGRHPISDERYLTKEDVVFKNVSSGRKPVIENKGITGVLPTTETSGSIETNVITEESERHLHLPPRETSSETRVINEGGVITRITTTTDENGVTTITKEYEGPTEIIESYEASSRGDAIEGSSREHLEGIGGRIARTTSDTNTDVTTDTTTDAAGVTTITTTTTTTTTDTTDTDTTTEGSRSSRK